MAPSTEAMKPAPWPAVYQPSRLAHVGDDQRACDADHGGDDEACGIVARLDGARHQTHDEPDQNSPDDAHEEIPFGEVEVAKSHARLRGSRP
jgi:hypothetical protein